MEQHKNEIKSSYNDRLENILKNLSKCKKTFTSATEECLNLRESNSKLITELKEISELEKSHRYHLVTSREMVANLQETVSHLVYLKRDIKKLNEELVSKDSIIETLEKEKEIVARRHGEQLSEVRAAHDRESQATKREYDRRVERLQIDHDIQIAQMTCEAEELRSGMELMQSEHKEQTNALLLQFEEKAQREAARRAQAEANLRAYRTKLESLEEKLKQSQFKEHLRQSSVVERAGALQPEHSEGKRGSSGGKKRKLYSEKIPFNQ